MPVSLLKSANLLEELRSRARQQARCDSRGGRVPADLCDWTRYQAR